MLPPVEKKEPSTLDPQPEAPLLMPVRMELYDPFTWPTRIEVGIDHATDAVQINISPAVLSDTIVRISREQVAILAHALLAFAPQGRKGT